MTYNCHSEARREQFSTNDGEIRVLDGSDANKKIMHRASSMSLTASMNDGYLERQEFSVRSTRAQYYRPLFDDMIQSIHWSILFQAFCTAPFSSSECTGKFLCKSLVFSELLQDRLVCKVCDILGVIERRWGRRPLICTLPITGLTGKYTFVEQISSVNQEARPIEIPLRIHSRRKSAKEHCNFLTAVERVI